MDLAVELTRSRMRALGGNPALARGGRPLA